MGHVLKYDKAQLIKFGIELQFEHFRIVFLGEVNSDPGSAQGHATETRLRQILVKDIRGEQQFIVRSSLWPGSEKNFLIDAGAFVIKTSEDPKGNKLFPSSFLITKVY